MSFIGEDDTTPVSPPACIEQNRLWYTVEVEQFDATQVTITAKTKIVDGNILADFPRLSALIVSDVDFLLGSEDNCTFPWPATQHISIPVTRRTQVWAAPVSGTAVIDILFTEA